MIATKQLTTKCDKIMEKEELFVNLKKGIVNKYYEDDKSIVLNGDSLDMLKSIPPQSISLILIDPPYHSTKKSNIINDTAFETNDDFVAWMENLAKQWKRVLKPNGSFFLFCSSAMEASLEMMLSKYFNILSQIVWTKPNDPGFDGWKGKMKKEALRKWYPHSERIIFCEQSVDPLTQKSYFSEQLKKWRTTCGLSCQDLTGKTGAFRKVNHGGAASNWESGRSVPSVEQYEKICDVLAQYNKGIVFPDYYDIIRPFEVNSEVQFTDVWEFPSVKQYKGKHPAEKPIEMLEHCIKSTTHSNDIVLDCFAGSGNALIAAIRNQRFCISMEIDEK